jgi:chemotaxis protein MotB
VSDTQPAEKKAHGGGGHGARHGHGPGGGAHEEHEGAPEWLISFADNVTLIMGFFVIMLAFSQGPKGGGDPNAPESGGSQASPTFLDAVVAIREGFNNPVNLNSMDPKERTLVQHLLRRRGLGVSEQNGPEGSEHDVQSLRPSAYYSVCGIVPFEHGSADISAEGARDLDAVAIHVKGLRLVVDVRGHVSADETSGDPQRTFRLSFERALAVAQGLVDRGLDWKQLHLVACADTDRVEAPSYDEEHHQPNRRVEIVVTDKVLGAP